MNSSTIFAASMLSHRDVGSVLVEHPRIDLLPDGVPGPRRFKIKVADSAARRGLIDGLLKERYGWRGYQAEPLATRHSVHRFTLAAVEHSLTIGTITVVFDGDQKLGADDAFGAEVNALRHAGRRLCEFTKLAVDPTTGTKRVLAALFHVAYLVAHPLRGHDTLVIEVNPRHVRYYERMLGCTVIGPERLNRSVKAPAVLLVVDFAHVRAQIDEFGGRPESASVERSLYPFAFSGDEEAVIVGRLQSLQHSQFDVLGC